MFLQFARTPAALGIARSYGLTGSVVLLNFAFITIAAWTLGADDFGTFSVLFSAAGLGAVFAVFGQHSMMLRSWHEHAAGEDYPRLKGSLIFALQSFLATFLVVGAVFALGVTLLYDSALAAVTLWYMWGLALGNITTHLARTAIGVEMGDGVEGIVAVTPPLAYLAICLAQGVSAELPTLFLVYGTGFAIASVIHITAIYRKLKRRFPQFFAASPIYERGVWMSRSLRLWLSSTIEACYQYLDVILFGLLMNPAAAGAYFVLTRLANLNATVANAMHVYSTRHLPDLYYRKDEAGLTRMLNIIARVTLVVMAGTTVVLVASGYWLLQIFNPLYGVYYPAMIVLTLGTAAVGMLGPSAAVLMFSGHERDFLRITLITLAVRIGAMLFLVPLFSVNGAVAAILCASIVMITVTRSAAYRLVGFDCSVLRLLPNYADSWSAGRISQ